MAGGGCQRCTATALPAAAGIMLQPLPPATNNAGCIACAQVGACSTPAVLPLPFSPQDSEDEADALKARFLDVLDELHAERERAAILQVRSARAQSLPLCATCG